MMRIEAMVKFIEEHPSFYKVDLYSRKLIFLERYLSIYMDFTLGAEDSIGRLLGSTPKEDYRTNSRMKLRLDQFMANEIKEAYGYDLNQFLQLPTFFMEDLLDRQRKLLKERRDAAERERIRAEQKANSLGLPNLGNGLHPFNRH